MGGCLPVQQRAILWTCEQVIWVGWVEVDLPHCQENQRHTYETIIYMHNIF